MTSKVLITTTLLVFSGCASLVNLVLPINDVPSPKGPSAVGTKTFFLTDNKRSETYTHDPNDFRRIVLQTWYPTNDTSGKTASYLDFFNLRIDPIAYQLGIDKKLLQNINKISTSSIVNGIPKNDKMLPLVIFSHGLGGFRVQNTIQFQELASRGYIVMSIDHPYDAHLTVFKDSTIADFRAEDLNNLTGDEFWKHWLPKIETRANDVSFIIDWAISESNNLNSDFYRCIDSTRIGIFGHSFGGGTSIYSMSRDERIKAAVALDGWVVPIPENTINKGLDRPFLYIGREKWSGPYNQYILQKLINNSTGPIYLSYVKGMKHFDYADIPHLSDRANLFSFTGTLEKDMMISIINESILDFFEHHLNTVYPLPEGRPLGLSKTNFKTYNR